MINDIVTAVLIHEDDIPGFVDRHIKAGHEIRYPDHKLPRKGGKCL